MAVKIQKTVLKSVLFALLGLTITFGLVSLILLNVWKELVVTQVYNNLEKSLNRAPSGLEGKSDLLAMTVVPVRAQVNGDTAVQFHDISSGATVIFAILSVIVFASGMLKAESLGRALKISFLALLATWTIILIVSSAFLVGSLYGRAFELPVDGYKHQFFSFAPYRKYYEELFGYLDRGQWIFPPLVAGSAALGLASALCLLIILGFLWVNMKEDWQRKTKVTFQEDGKAKEKEFLAKEKVLTRNGHE